MKTYIFLCCTTIFALSPVNLISQNSKVKIEEDKTLTVDQVFDIIMNQTDYKFFYEEGLFKDLPKIKVKKGIENTNKLLNRSLSNGNFSVVITDNNAVIVKEKLPDTRKEIQQLTISGKVVDENGMPLPGASVLEKGTTNSTVTDFDGNFTLKASNNATLVISFIGYKSSEISVKDRTTLKVSLQPNVSGLDEVVVTGYGSTLRKNLTTSISKIKVDDIQKAASSNVSQLLVGRASGLQATIASAQPGGNVNISIRGAGTPLYVVDGVVMPSDSQESGSGGSVTVVPNNVNRSGLAGLNPQDIESVEVLKDASAAIYGINAGNGVILITTKKGKEGKVKVTYDGSYSTVNNTKYLQPLNSQQFMGLANVFNKEAYLYAKNMAPYGTNVYDNNWTPVYSDQEIASAKTTNWRDKVLRDGSIANQNIIINGGTNKLNYYLSGNYFKQVGTVSKSSMERYSFRGKISSQLNDFVKLTTTFNTNNNSYENSSVGGASSGRASQAGGSLTAALTYLPFIPVYEDSGEYGLYQNVPNPVAMEKIEDVTNSNGVVVNFVADVDVIRNMLSAKLLYGYNKEESRRSVYIPSDVYFDQMYRSRGNLAMDNRQNRTMEATLSYTNKFAEVLDLNAVFGVGKYLDGINGMNVAYDNAYDAIANDNLGAASGIFTPGSYRGANEKRSQFGRVNLDFFNRYVLSATLRRDGTDKFFPGKKYAFFPSVSGAWKLSNEEFMKEITVINMLKIRASYGETGSDNLGTSLYGSYRAWGNQIMFSNNSVKYIPVIQSGSDYPDVTWQKTTMKNIGIDYSVFKDRISGSFDIYRNDITNMLSYANTAPLSLFGSYPINGGHIKRYGWDATINSKNITTNNFKWNSVLTLSRYNSIWKEREPNYNYLPYQIQKDEPVNAQYYYATNGIINSDKSNMPSSQPSWAQRPGYPVIVDKNEDGEITVKDVQMVNATPKLYWGYGNTFTYKNFDLDIFIYSQLGVKKYNYTYSWNNASTLANRTTNSNTYAFELWNSQTNTNGTKPGIAWDLASQSLPGGAGTDIGFEDSSFVRVRNITFGYNFPNSMLGAFGKHISNIRVYADVQNPLLFTSFKGFDPEVYSGGNYNSGKAEYPQTRTFSVGLKATF